MIGSVLESPEVSEIAHEIAGQPDDWRRAATLARDVRDALPPPGARVAAVGCGTSLYVARAFAALRETLGRGETDAFPASEYPLTRRYDAVVLISRSGTTTEVLRLLEDLGPGAPTTAITAVAGSPTAERSGRAIVLDFADERSVVQTRFATTTLALLRTHVGDDVGAAARDAATALDLELPVPPGAFEHVVFLGTGWTVGLAEEAALKLREAAAVRSEAYPAMEYRHGPISSAGDGSFVWILGSPDPAVGDDVAATGATVRLASLDPMAELVLAQRLAVASADAAGLDPDHPRHLTRSVVLDMPPGRSEGQDRIYSQATRGDR